MHAEERHQAILARVRAHGSIRVTEVAEALAVSPVTIRKDVEILAQRGLLMRVHGGAMLPEDFGQSETKSNTTSAAQRLGHEPTVGMVVPTEGYYHHDVIKGAGEAAAALGVRLIVRIADYDPAEERRHSEQLIAHGADGLLLIPSELGERDDAESWHEQLSVPVVLVERRPREERRATEQVVSDHVYGAQLAVRHLADQGRRRIALVLRRGTPTAPWVEEGYLAGLGARGLQNPTGETFIDMGNKSTGEPAYDQPLTEFVDAAQAGRIDAAIVHPETDALLILHSLRGRGLRVPEDIALVSYDDELAPLADIPLTAVAPPKQEVGYSAVELLVSRLAKAERPPRRMTILPRLTVRASSVAKPSSSGS